MNQLAWAYIAITCLLGSTGLESFADELHSPFEQSLIGREWFPARGDVGGYPLSDNCQYQGAGTLRINGREIGGSTVTFFECSDQRPLQLIAQSQMTGAEKILDALLLPKLKTGEEYAQLGHCTLNGISDTHIAAVVKFGRREEVSWKTGVRAAWAINPETLKFEPLAKHQPVVCEKPTPP